MPHFLIVLLLSISELFLCSEGVWTCITTLFLGHSLRGGTGHASPHCSLGILSEGALDMHHHIVPWAFSPRGHWTCITTFCSLGILSVLRGHWTCITTLFLGHSHPRGHWTCITTLFLEHISPRGHWTCITNSNCSLGILSEGALDMHHHIVLGHSLEGHWHACNVDQLFRGPRAKSGPPLKMWPAALDKFKKIKQSNHHVFLTFNLFLFSDFNVRQALSCLCWRLFNRNLISDPRVNFFCYSLRTAWPTPPINVSIQFWNGVAACIWVILIF